MLQREYNVDGRVLRIESKMVFTRQKLAIVGLLFRLRGLPYCLFKFGGCLLKRRGE